MAHCSIVMTADRQGKEEDGQRRKNGGEKGAMGFGATKRKGKGTKKKKGILSGPRRKNKAAHRHLKIGGRD